MKVLLISVKSDRSKGGISTWTERYFDECKSFDMDIDLVNTEVTGKRLLEFTAKRNFFDEIGRTKRIFHDLNLFLRDKSNVYDAVHLNTSCGNFGIFRDYIIASRVKKKKVKLITHFHCDIPFWVHNSLNRKFVGKLAKISDVNLVLCENSSRYLKENFEVQSVKFPNFINEDMIRKDDKAIKSKISKAFFVGRVSEEKGAKELYALAQKFPGITFELVGEVSETVSSWKKPDNIELIGQCPHSEVIERMDDSDIFVFPTYSEGFSLALTEAMARGLPVITTDTGANMDMLENKGGKVVPIGDVEAMKEAINTMEDFSVRDMMSKWNIEKVKRCYVGKVIISELYKYYKEV